MNRTCSAQLSDENCGAPAAAIITFDEVEAYFVCEHHLGLELDRQPPPTVVSMRPMVSPPVEVI